MKPISVLRAFFAIAVPAAAWAQATLPTGANVVAGSATISATANSMTVATGSPRTIIDYSGFNVGTGNSVRFDQPSSASATLNRVISTEGSSILGSVSSNGQIFLVNPNGIFVGAGGSFSGSSVYLSTGNISNADFLGGNIRFDPLPPGTTIRSDGNLVATDDIFVNASNVDLSGTMSHGGLGTITTVPGSMTIDLPALTLDGTATLSEIPRFQGTLVIHEFKTGGNLVLNGGIRPPVFADTAIVGGSLTFAPAPAARLVAPSIPRGTSGLVDGTVTVRLSLVDAAPISLR